MQIEYVINYTFLISLKIDSLKPEIPFSRYCEKMTYQLLLFRRINLNNKKMKNTLLIITCVALVGAMTNCKKGCTDPAATNFDSKAKKENNTCEYIIDEGGLNVPTTYSFVDGNGVKTVDFSGQAQRLDMLSEMVTYMKTANTQGIFVSSTQLKDMYSNNAYTWTDANSLGMTGSSKQLKDKTAYSSADGSPDAGIQLLFETYMDSIDIISNYNRIGSAGVSGVWPNDGSKGPYLMDGNGFDYAEGIEKGLMSAVFASQITINYLGTLNDDDNTSLVSGKNYTDMQHHWDEAYGYFTSATDFPASGTDRFWGEYGTVVEPLTLAASKIMDAFRTGRAAIDAKDYVERDLQIVIIRNQMEKIQAASAIHYLNTTKTQISNNTARGHALTEAYSFLNGMRFGYNAVNSIGMTTAEIDQALGFIGTDFNNVTVSGLNLAIDLIASKTGLDSVKGDL